MARILSPRIYTFPTGEQRLILTHSVLETFCQYRQGHLASEAGGLLFAEFALPDIYVVEAVPPGENDKRSRFSFLHDRTTQRQIVRNRFKDDRHLVGEWHTHPEPYPTPSRIDLNSMSDSFLKSKHELESFIMIIVGDQPGSLNLWVSAHTETETCQLAELQVQSEPSSLRERKQRN